MFDTLMNPVALKESTATVDLSILQFIFISYISAHFTSAKLCRLKFFALYIYIYTIILFYFYFIPLYLTMLENMDSSIDAFFSTRPRNLHNFELYLNLLAFKGEYKQALGTLELIKVIPLSSLPLSTLSPSSPVPSTSLPLSRIVKLGLELIFLPKLGPGIRSNGQGFQLRNPRVCKC